MCRRTDIVDKVYAQVKVIDMGYDTPCHIWMGPDSGKGRGGGYSRMNLNGHTVAVHRVMFTHKFGFIPGKKQIDHKCTNRRCVNPCHLEMVTHRENQRRKRNDS